VRKQNNQERDEKTTKAAGGSGIIAYSKCTAQTAKWRRYSKLVLVQRQRRPCYTGGSSSSTTTTTTTTATI